MLEACYLFSFKTFFLHYSTTIPFILEITLIISKDETAIRVSIHYRNEPLWQGSEAAYPSRWSLLVVRHDHCTLSRGGCGSGCMLCSCECSISGLDVFQPTSAWPDKTYRPELRQIGRSQCTGPTTCDLQFQDQHKPKNTNKVYDLFYILLLLFNNTSNKY